MNARGVVNSLLYVLAKALSDGLFWEILRPGLEKLREKIVESDNKIDDAVLPIIDMILGAIPDDND